MRVVAVVATATADRGSVPLGVVGSRVLPVALVLPLAYLSYSIKVYFTYRRALGADHFDPSYRGAPLVEQGIFRYFRNPMYVFGPTILWIPALWWSSRLALILAAFHHAYLWVHYLCTERPDMARIYGGPD